MKRVLYVGAAGLVILIAAGVWWFAASVDGLVARAIEFYGSAALGTEVRVGSVELALREGRGTIRGLRVGNPDGFSSGDAIRFEELTLAIDPSSVLGTPVVVDTIRLKDPRIRFEVSSAGSSNLQKLQQNVSAYVPAEEDTAESTSATAEPEAGSAPLRLRIAEVSMEKGLAQADLRAMGDEERTLELRSFRITNLGGSQGAEPPELAKQFARQLTEQLVRNVAQARTTTAIKEKAGELLKDRPEAAEAVKGLLDSFGGGSNTDR